MLNNRKSGFTLIELLIVIAIIAILSAIVLASLNAARIKSSDAAVKQQLSQTHTAAEFIYDSDSNYNAVCNIGSDTYKLFIAAINNGSGSPGSAYCLPPGTPFFYLGSGGIISSQLKSFTPGQWAMAVQMKGGMYFCVDYTGNSISTSTLTISTSDLTCN